MSENGDQLTMYADYVCPFCYLGRRSLDTYLESRDETLEIDWQPFDLRSQKRGPDGEIDHTIDDGKDDAYFEQVHENVARLRDEYGAEEMRDLDELPEHVDSLNAQVASLYVKSEHPDRWSAFDEAIYETLWVNGRDIGDFHVLVDIAESVGVVGDELRKALEDDELRARLRNEFTAAQANGITGVPTFVYGEYVARGAVPPEHIARLVGEA